jgi:hypothetical protein
MRFSYDPVGKASAAMGVCLPSCHEMEDCDVGMFPAAPPIALYGLTLGSGDAPAPSFSGVERRVRRRGHDALPARDDGAAA